MSSQHHIRTEKLVSNVWTPVAFAQDTPGRLNGIGVAMSDNTEQFVRVSVDGQEHSEKFCGSASYGNSGLSFDIPFEKSMRVMARNQSPTPETRVWVTYITTSEDPW